MADSSLTIVGALGKDPELMFTAGGRAACSLTVATSRRWKQGDDWKEKTAWVSVTVWGELGEHVAASCSKGTRVILTGYLDEDEWDDRETGKRRTKLKMVADAVGVELRYATAIVERIERTGRD